MQVDAKCLHFVMFYMKQNKKKRKQTLESAQYGLEIILKAQPLLCTYKYMIQHNKSEVLKSKNKLALKMRN